MEHRDKTRTITGDRGDYTFCRVYETGPPIRAYCEWTLPDGRSYLDIVGAPFPPDGTTPADWYNDTEAACIERAMQFDRYEFDPDAVSVYNPDDQPSRFWWWRMEKRDAIKHFVQRIRGRRP